jgi:Secretion system C-terminal sorting domain
MKQFKIISMILFIQLNVLATAFAVDLSGVLEGGIFRTNATTLEVRLKPTTTIPAGLYSDGWFVVKYPTLGGITGLTVSSSAPMYTVFSSSTDGGYTYFAFYTNSFDYSIPPPPDNWVGGTEQTIAVLGILGTAPANYDFSLTNDTYANTITGGSAWYQELFVAGFSGPAEGAFYHQSALPIELTKFTAKAQPDHTVALDWETATELNFSHYEVEHSSDGAKFNQIGRVIGKGTQNGPEAYGFIHDRPVNSDNYYRLRIVDNDAAFSYSPVQIVRFANGNDHFKLSPNPTAGPFSLISTELDHYKDDLRYQIFDVTGKLIEEGLVKDEILDFDLTNYKSGMYSFAILSNKEFIKQFQLVLTTN